MTPLPLAIQPLTVAHIRELLTWRYEGPYAMYDLREEDEDAAVAFFSDHANGYLAILGEGDEFLGFCNFGADARVPGGNYTAGAVDIGMGMRPDLTGRGQGARYAAAVFAFAGAQFPAARQRVTIAGFNERAQRLCRGFGFEVCSSFTRPADGRPFLIMMRAQPDPGG